MQEMISVSPYKELRLGDESIYDHVLEGYSVPDCVIAYLRTTQPYLMSPGVYEHPFRPGTRLLGPYLYTDGKYCWDRDTWKYVVKYHVTLPQDFIDHVMSDEGKAFIGKFGAQPASWTGFIENRKEQEDSLCFLPADAGDISLEGF